jgi:hypothetical protein
LKDELPASKTILGKETYFIHNMVEQEYEIEAMIKRLEGLKMAI